MTANGEILPRFLWYLCCLVSCQIRQWLAQAHNAFGHDDHIVNAESSIRLKGAGNSCEERMSFESLTGERASVLLEDLEDGIIFRRCLLNIISGAHVTAALPIEEYRFQQKSRGNTK